MVNLAGGYQSPQRDVLWLETDGFTLTSFRRQGRSGIEEGIAGTWRVDGDDVVLVAKRKIRREHDHSIDIVRTSEEPHEERVEGRIVGGAIHISRGGREIVLAKA